ncbi:MAG: hypothetical protein KJ799_18550 [Bacteroidetes bacterium]|nr:hypothetical protein [Bacteroidota bacterium]MBU1679680.1 hypothetical protein [Bacteroidota bacterium]MBU2508698.1 hypothetical protein [Bacteroidota bacterium]
MKRLSILFVILFFNNLFAQQASRVLFEEYSHNKAYKTSIEGNYYEGFSGSQEVTLYDSENKILWQNIFPADNNVQIPIVSNKGDVALPLSNRIEFYDKTGKMIGVYSPDENGKIWHLTCLCSPVHTYSNSGTNYFTFIKAKPITKFVSISKNGKAIWEYDLGKYEPTSIQIFDKSIIIDDFSIAGRQYENCCYIFDEQGNCRFKYQADIKNPSSPPIIVNEMNELWLYDEKKVKRIDLISYSLKDDVNDDEILNLIHKDDPRILQFALYLLRHKIKNVEYSSDHFKRLEYLSAIKINHRKWTNPPIGKLSSELLEFIKNK